MFIIKNINIIGINESLMGYIKWIRINICSCLLRNILYLIYWCFIKNDDYII